MSCSFFVNNHQDTILTMAHHQYYQVRDVVADGNIRIREYRNPVTGIRIFLAPTEGPLYRARMVFVTESNNSSGLGYALDSLVSEWQHQADDEVEIYGRIINGSGCLDDFKSQSISYTFSSYCSDKFFHNLISYLDRLLIPDHMNTLFEQKDPYYIGPCDDTFPISFWDDYCGDGDDYRCRMKIISDLYPGYDTDFGSDTLSRNLYESGYLQRVRMYHEKYFHSKNTAIILTGPIDKERLFNEMWTIDEKLVQRKLHSIPFERPQVLPVSTHLNPMTRLPTYRKGDRCLIDGVICGLPTDDGMPFPEISGGIYLGLPGLDHRRGHPDVEALPFLLEYLNNPKFENSPLRLALMDQERPCCRDVNHYILGNSRLCFYFNFKAEQENISECISVFCAAIRKVIVEDKLDMARISAMIEREKLKILALAENAPELLVEERIVHYIVYGVGDMRQICRKLDTLRELKSKSSSYWIGLMVKYFPEINTGRYSCVSEPVEDDSLYHAVLDQFKEQRGKVEWKYPSLARYLLTRALVTNRVSLINKFPRPEEIVFRSIERVVVKECTNVRLQYDHIRTNFVTIQLLLNTSKCFSPSERLYVPLIMSCLTRCSKQRVDGAVDYLESTKKDLLNYDVSLGLGFKTDREGRPLYLDNVSAFDCIRVTMKVEPSKYQKAVQLYLRLLYQTVYKLAEVAAAIDELLSTISFNINNLSLECLMYFIYKSDSNNWATTQIAQHEMLLNLRERLRESPHTTLQQLSALHERLCQPDNLLVHITLDKDKIDVNTIYQQWDQMTRYYRQRPLEVNTLSISDIRHAREMVVNRNRPEVFILGISNQDYSNIKLTALTVDSLDDPKLPWILVVVEHTLKRSSLRRSLLRYSRVVPLSIVLEPAEGMIGLSISAYDLRKAYEDFKRELFSYAQGEVSKNDLEDAKLAAMARLVSSEESVEDRSRQSLLAYINGTDINYTSRIVCQIATITRLDFMQGAGRLYKRIYESNDVMAAICCPQNAVSHVSLVFSWFGFSIKGGEQR